MTSLLEEETLDAFDDVKTSPGERRDEEKERKIIEAEAERVRKAEVRKSEVANDLIMLMRSDKSAEKTSTNRMFDTKNHLELYENFDEMEKKASVRSDSRRNVRRFHGCFRHQIIRVKRSFSLASHGLQKLNIALALCSLKCIVRALFKQFSIAW